MKKGFIKILSLPKVVIGNLQKLFVVKKQTAKNSGRSPIATFGDDNSSYVPDNNGMNNKVILRSGNSGSRPYKNQSGWNAEYQPFSMISFKAGFTLIELLVVVLIIAILAAVALPQYQMVVMKNRFATMMPIVKALAEAEELYYMQNGSYTTDFAALDIEAPAGGTLREGGESIQYPYFYCRLFINDLEPNVYCHGGNEYGYYRQNLRHSPTNPGQRFCLAYEDKSGKKEKLCRSFGGTNIEGSKWTMP